MRAKGYETFIQDKDFGHSDFMSKMNEGFAFIDRGARLIAILSPAYLAKEHCLKEANHPLIDDPHNKREKLIVFRIAECLPTGMLKALRYTDLVPHLDDEASLSRVVLQAVDGYEIKTATTEIDIKKLMLLLETKDEQKVEKALNRSTMMAIILAGLIVAFNVLLGVWNDTFGTYYYPLFDGFFVSLSLVGFLVFLGYGYNETVKDIATAVVQQKPTIDQLRALRDAASAREWQNKNLIKAAVARAILERIEKSS